MATRHQVTCITPDGADADQRIDAVGGLDAGGWKLLIDNAIQGLENGSFTLWTTGGGAATEVRVHRRPNGRKYLKTDADGIEPNNLLALPLCP